MNYAEAHDFSRVKDVKVPHLVALIAHIGRPHAYVIDVSKSSMNRRPYLAGMAALLGASTAGCLGNGLVQAPRANPHDSIPDDVPKAQQQQLRFRGWMDAADLLVAVRPEYCSRDITLSLPDHDPLEPGAEQQFTFSVGNVRSLSVFDSELLEERELSPHDTLDFSGWSFDPETPGVLDSRPQQFWWEDCQSIEITGTIGVRADADPRLERYTVIVIDRAGELLQMERRSVLISA